MACGAKKCVSLTLDPEYLGVLQSQVPLPEPKSDVSARKSKGHVKDEDVRHGRYAARAPEPASRRPVPVDDRYNPRETSAELEERVHGPGLGRCRTPSPSPPRVAQHKEPPRVTLDEGGVQYARRRDLSPSPAPRKRQRHDSPEEGPPPSRGDVHEARGDAGHEEGRSRRDVVGQDRSPGRGYARDSRIPPRSDREQGRRDDNVRTSRESDRRRDADGDLYNSRRGRPREGRNVDEGERRRRTPSGDMQAEPRRREERDRSPRRDSR
jgi:hypothetical protein